MSYAGHLRPGLQVTVRAHPPATGAETGLEPVRAHPAADLGLEPVRHLTRLGDACPLSELQLASVSLLLVIRRLVRDHNFHPVDTGRIPPHPPPDSQPTVCHRTFCWSESFLFIRWLGQTASPSLVQRGNALNRAAGAHRGPELFYY